MFWLAYQGPHPTTPTLPRTGFSAQRYIRSSTSTRSVQPRPIAFVAFYLANRGWQKSEVGLALAVGTISGVISQIPGGALIDALPWKRALAAAGIGMICASALILALIPSFTLVFVAQILHGLTSGVATPAIAAISLGLVGRRAMSARTGRNYRFDALGNALTAGAMGLAGYYWAKSAFFLLLRHYAFRLW